MVPNPALVDRFRTDLDALIELGARFGVAVSGGPDSLALLLLAAAARPGDLEAATVDHGLRPESRAEAEQVADICRAAWASPHSVLAIEWDLPPTSAIQEQARAVRYGALAQWMRERELTALLTAHHLDDQAETLLMRLNRGSGVRGLGGMRPPEPSSRRSGTDAAPAFARLAAAGTRGNLRTGEPQTHRRSKQFRRAPRARPGSTGSATRPTGSTRKRLARSARTSPPPTKRSTGRPTRNGTNSSTLETRRSSTARRPRRSGDHPPHRRPGHCGTGHRRRARRASRPRARSADRRPPGVQDDHASRRPLHRRGGLEVRPSPTARSRPS